ncbi:MAG: hypothetical protein MUE85_00130 [Microscillaceae bacterium]|nr:hypothetical protein [Microscillaceae bacterium]
MKRKLKVLLFSGSILVLGALTIPVKNTPPTTVAQSPAPSWFKQNAPSEATMAPAWYQYFDLKKAENIDNNSQITLKFVKVGEQSSQLSIFNLINTSGQAQKITTQDGSLIMIQEAKNPQGKWQPIEYWNFDWGMGATFGTLDLPAQHSVLFTAPQFKGNFATEVRFKLKMNDQTIFYSEPFVAKITASQFKVAEQGQKVSYLE